MKTIILVSGKKRAGKDTVAQMIVEQLNSAYSISRLSFAEPMKEILADTFDVELEDLEDYKNSPKLYPVMVLHPELVESFELSTDMRKILQRFGTEAMKKQFGDDVWSELLYKKIYSDITVVPDWRFKSELEFLKKQPDVKVVTIRVNRIGQVVHDEHISEKDLDDVKTDFTLNNEDDNLDWLEEQVYELCREIPKQSKIGSPDYFKCNQVC